MPDPVVISQAVACAAAVAALLFLAVSWPRRPPAPPRVAVGWVLALAAGTYVGCRILNLWPNWPPTDERDRYLLFLLPAVLLAELLALIPKLPKWLPWAFRVLVALIAMRLLLHSTVYVKDFPGANALWSRTQAEIVCNGLAVALIAAWALLVVYARRRPGPVLPVALVLSTSAASVSVMLSAYAIGGQLGLPLAAALAGAALASTFVRGAPVVVSWVGPMVVALFGLLAMGHFFGSLTVAHGLLLFLAPLACWLPEVLPYARRLQPRRKDALAVVLVVVLAGLAVMQARQTFLADMKALMEPTDSEEDSAAH